MIRGNLSLGVGALTALQALPAQQPRIPRIGYLTASSASGRNGLRRASDQWQVSGSLIFRTSSVGYLEI